MVALPCEHGVKVEVVIGVEVKFVITLVVFVELF